MTPRFLFDFLRPINPEFSCLNNFILLNGNAQVVGARLGVP